MEGTAEVVSRLKQRKEEKERLQSELYLLQGSQQYSPQESVALDCHFALW